MNICDMVGENVIETQEESSKKGCWFFEFGEIINRIKESFKNLARAIKGHGNVK